MNDGMIDASEVHQFADKLHDVPVNQRIRVARVVQKATDDTARRARAKAPKDRPWLSTSDGIHGDFALMGGNAVGTVWTGADPDGEYVGFRVEYGTSRMRPQPFMVPAIQEARRPMIDDINKILGTGW